MSAAPRWQPKQMVIFLGLFVAAAMLLVTLRTPVHADSINTTDFVTTWKTDNPGVSCDSCIYIPTSGGGYNYDVDWDNDGEFDQFGITTSVTHDFGTPGVYTIRIRGDYPQRGSGDASKLLEVNQWGSIQWRSMNSAFAYAVNLSIPATDAPDLTNVTDMSSMFLSAHAFNDDISHWETGNITNMSGVFSDAPTFNQDISGWDTGNVTTMSSMFNKASAFNQDISGWSTDNVTNMGSMFSDASSFDQNIGTWDMSSVTIASGMLLRAGLSTSTYDQILKGWSVQSLNEGVTLTANEITYCTAASEHAFIISNFSWQIYDEGQDCGFAIDGSGLSSGAIHLSGVSVEVGSVVGSLSVAEYLSLRDNLPYELACNVSGVDDLLFSINEDTLVASATLAHDTQYELCVKMTTQDGQEIEQNFSLILSGPRVISGVTFDPQAEKVVLTVTGSGMFGVNDEELLTSFTTRSLVRVNGADLGFCAEGFGLTAEAIATAYGMDPALVSDDPPCYELIGEGGTVILATGSQVKVWLPSDFDIEATGTVSVNGSNTYTFNAVTPPDDEDDETEEPNPGEDDDTPPAPEEQPESPKSSSRSSGLGQRNTYVAQQNTPDADEERAQEIAPTVYVNGNKPVGQNPTIPKRPTFSGVATPGAEVVVMVDDNRCSAKADESGNWHCTLAADLEPGVHTVNTTITNPDGSTVQLDPFMATVLGVSTTAPEVENDTPEGGISLWILVGTAIVVALALTFGVVRYRKTAS